MQEAQLLQGWTAIFVTVKCPQKVIQGQRSLLLSAQWRTFLFIDTMGLGATVKTLRSIFTFRAMLWFSSYPVIYAVVCYAVAEQQLRLSCDLV